MSNPKEEFIAELYPAARRIGRETGMSWELILAQAALETGWGEKTLPGTNNIFNIKADSSWHGESKSFNVPEYVNGRRVQQDASFRVYDSIDDALRDRVQFLRENPRYAQAGLFNDGVKGNLAKEADALQKAGYATDPHYAATLNEVFHGRTMRHGIEQGSQHMGVAPGQSQTKNTGQSNPASAQSATAAPAISSDAAHGAKAALPSAAILNEAQEHFFKSGKRFEYSQSDRLEGDHDHDGRLGVDCSSFVWRGLKDAGYNVPGSTASGFTTYTMFNGSKTTAFAEKNFDVISAADARKPGGDLKPGDLLMFTGNGSQHVGIFKGYDANGHIHFVGSQTRNGPAEESIVPKGYWDGGHERIVGALRAKPEFQVRAPLHGDPGASIDGRSAAPTARGPLADGKLVVGEQGAEVKALQKELIELGVKHDGGKLLTGTGYYGDHTKQAVTNFQKENGLQPTGISDKATLDAIGKQVREHRMTHTNTAASTAVPKNLPTADSPLISDSHHPNHKLYAAIGKQLPPGTKPEVVANVTMQSMENGITSADKLKSVTVQGQDAFVVGTTPGYRVKVDLEAPTAPMPAMSDHMNRQTQELQHRATQPAPSQGSVMMA